MHSLQDLLFCPDFTVNGARRSGPDKAEELTNIDSCEYIYGKLELVLHIHLLETVKLMPEELSY